MKARLYRATGPERDYIDGYTLYLPFPEWMRLLPEYLPHGTKGTFLGCSPASDGTMIRCSWDDMDSRYNFEGLGRKVKIESMPEPFQKEVRRIEKLWNDAIKYNDDEHWNIWNTQA